MRTALLVAILMASAATASAQGYGQNRGSGLYGTGSNPSSNYVAPHFNSKGSLFEGHYRTNPNNTQMDNFGTRGNQNPYTGNFGTRVPKY